MDPPGARCDLSAMSDAAALPPASPSSPSSPGAWTPLARAVRAWLDGDLEATLTVHDSLGNKDPLPASWFFRPVDGGRDDALFPLERAALEACRGRVLDVGAGTGIHSLALQARGLGVTALEIDPQLAVVLRERGVREVREGTVADLADLPEAERFDTLLLLMNGWGLAGTRDELPIFLDELEAVLAPGGQVLADSTDLRPLFEREGFEPAEDEYPGDVDYRMEFAGEKGDPFPFVFLDPETLEQVASAQGWQVEFLARNGEDGYLSRLTRR